jgi:hypothetical protein
MAGGTRKVCQEWHELNRETELSSARFFGPPKIVEALQVHPEGRGHSERKSELNCRFCSNASLTVQDLRNPVVRNVNPPSEFRGTYI